VVVPMFAADGTPTTAGLMSLATTGAIYTGSVQGYSTGGSGSPSSVVTVETAGTFDASLLYDLRARIHTDS
jgi:hypothetical protein